MNKNKNITIGIVLVALGIFLIVQKTIGLDIEVWSFIWPLFLLVPGITMHINYFSKEKKSGNLVVAGVLTVYGGLFLFNILTNNTYNDKLTFIYTLAIAIGFFENYIFGNKKNTDLSAALVFLIIAAIIFLKDIFPDLYFLREYIFPSILIIFGVYVLIKRRE